MEAIVLAVFPLLVVVKMLLNFSNCCTKTQSCSLSLVVSIATRVAVSRSIAKTGVNIRLILLRLKDRENAENDRSFDRISINFPLFEMEFLRNWFGNPAQGR